MMLQSSGKTALETGTVYPFKNFYVNFLNVHRVILDVLHSC